MIFKNINGVLIDPIPYTKAMITKYPYVTIHVGTDSQSIAKRTQYATVIAYRLGNRGVHYIVHKIEFPEIKDLWTRLWKETEMSIDIAEQMKESLDIEIQIDMDYNEDESYKSNRLVNASRGWANSLGYRVNMKPNIQVATRAADHHCK
tara:strand:+ start:13053 stop:13499 length:447 start_codon:yes stop_codon:yes gene_type:complete